MGAAVREPLVDISIFKKRRTQLANKIKDGVLVLSSSPEHLRNHDSHYEYRQDSNFFYLTGFEEPESVFVFRPGLKPESILFVRKKDPLRETWDGFRYGPAAAQKVFEIDEVYEFSELSKRLPDLLKPTRHVYHLLRQYNRFDELIFDALEEVKISLGRSGRGHLSIHDPSEILGEMRLFKTPEEQEWQKKACDISAEAHIAAMKFVRPGVNERQVKGVLLQKFLELGSERVGYNPIVASGGNATTLHYVFNDQVCKNGDLLLIDAGAEFNYYSGDITRTFPINGNFSQSQKLVYEKVLYIQKAILKMIKPGVVFEELQNTTIDLITAALIELKLLKGDKTELIKNNAYKKYYPHGVSHWLGMDVHDAGLYMIDGKSRKIEANMCFTVEPGIYIPVDDELAPNEFRGIGVRIEDDIIVTQDGYVNLTMKAPKEIADIEELMGS